ncbi:MAG: hypothetical protein A2319_05070 [Candidatus Kerfeldbacteria bacterium RIFOXYB2_FULL_38_14]|uniref:Uncharacterized protein n=1 Tax=Candidatus Kerfeldbacteria bacterium RIFOXYB2_FULL_38_14 TaxID=1798547 RepID=A0A1G2BF60_9BACT|nr:MAG: hypothetical protein A2319_05070 [Candidatus Kerfeldbacteria bacterium RIFOXYB2_FULL_38_14]
MTDTKKPAPRGEASEITLSNGAVAKVSIQKLTFESMQSENIWLFQEDTTRSIPREAYMALALARGDEVELIIFTGWQNDESRKRGPIPQLNAGEPIVIKNLTKGKTMDLVALRERKRETNEEVVTHHHADNAKSKADWR